MMTIQYQLVLLLAVNVIVFYIYGLIQQSRAAEKYRKERKDFEFEVARKEAELQTAAKDKLDQTSLTLAYMQCLTASLTLNRKVFSAIPKDYHAELSLILNTLWERTANFHVMNRKGDQFGNSRYAMDLTVELSSAAIAINTMLLEIEQNASTRESESALATPVDKPEQIG